MEEKTVMKLFEKCWISDFCAKNSQAAYEAAKKSFESKFDD